MDQVEQVVIKQDLQEHKRSLLKLIGRISYLLCFIVLTNYYMIIDADYFKTSIGNQISYISFSILISIITIILVQIKKDKLVKLIYLYMFILLIVNYFLPFLYHKLYLIDKQLSILLYKLNIGFEFNEQLSLLKFQTYLCYGCVHISTYYLVDQFREPPIKPIIYLTFISYGLSLLIGDVIMRLLLTMFALTLNQYFYIRSARSAHLSEANPQKLILVAMYGLYSLMILVEILLYDFENYLSFPIVYNMLLLICVVNLKVKFEITFARLFEQTGKLIIIFTFLLFAILAADFVVRIMSLILAVIFCYFIYLTVVGNLCLGRLRLKTTWINEKINIFLNIQEDESIIDCIHQIDYKNKNMIHSKDFEYFAKVAHLPVIIVPHYYDQNDLHHFFFLFDQFKLDYWEYLKNPLSHVRKPQFEPIDINLAFKQELQIVENRIQSILQKYQHLIN